MQTELAPEVEARMRPIWKIVDVAIRTDQMMVVEIAEMARRAAETYVPRPLRPARVVRTPEEKIARRRETQRRYQARKRAELAQSERIDLSVQTKPETGEPVAKKRPTRRGGQARLSDEERALRAAEKRERHRVRMASRTPEERAQHNARRRELRAALSPEDREAANAKAREAYRRKVAAASGDLDAMIAAGVLDESV